MGIWDWVQTGIGIHNPSPSSFKGSYKVTVGTGLLSFMGGRHTHVFGPDARLVVDPEELLDQFLPPWLTALTSGLCGNATFVYGTNTTATYVGPKVDIQRAPRISRISKSFLARKGKGDHGEWTETQDDPIDTAAAAAVAVLSLLAIAAAATFEIYMYVHYRDFSDEKGGPAETPMLMAIGSYAIPSRLLAFMQWLETKGCYASWAEVSLIDGVRKARWDAYLDARREKARIAEQRRAEAERRRIEEADRAGQKVMSDNEK